jgi:hypothetical protein
MPRHAASRASRSRLAVAILVSAAASLVASCTRSTSCDVGACTTGTTLTARVAIAPATLGAAGVEVCRNGACSTRGDAVTSGVSGSEQRFALRGALAGSGTITSIDAATSRLTIAIDDPGAAQADGDTYALTVRDGSSGATLYAIERTVLYDRPAVAEGCPARCSQAAVRVYPSSASGLTCSARACTAGLTLRGTTRVARHDLEGATLHVCRNATCGGLTLTSALPAGPSDQAAFVVHGALDAAIVIAVSPDGVFGVTVAVTADPADLTDGDLYQVELLNPGGGRVLGFSMPVTYAESFPDGADCDVVPCRTADGALTE